MAEKSKIRMKKNKCGHPLRTLRSLQNVRESSTESFGVQGISVVLTRLVASWRRPLNSAALSFYDAGPHYGIQAGGTHTVINRAQGHWLYATAIRSVWMYNRNRGGVTNCRVSKVNKFSLTPHTKRRRSFRRRAWQDVVQESWSRINTIA